MAFSNSLLSLESFDNSLTVEEVIVKPLLEKGSIFYINSDMLGGRGISHMMIPRRAESW